MLAKCSWKIVLPLSLTFALALFILVAIVLTRNELDNSHNGGEFDLICKVSVTHIARDKNGVFHSNIQRQIFINF